MMVWRIGICVEELGVYLYVIDWWYPKSNAKERLGRTLISDLCYFFFNKLNDYLNDCMLVYVSFEIIHSHIYMYLIAGKMQQNAWSWISSNKDIRPADMEEILLSNTAYSKLLFSFVNFHELKWALDLKNQLTIFLKIPLNK